MSEAALLEVNDVKKHFALPGGGFGGERRFVYAVDGVSFTVRRGETLSIVGESGCGKSTVGKVVLGLTEPTDGQIVLNGTRVDQLSNSARHPYRRRIQVVFQDPFSSLNPRMRVGDILAEPIRNFGLAKSREDLQRRLEALMQKVGLPKDALGRWPHEFSGGQRQRVGIARALAAEPDLIVCDEAVSALDVSVKAQIVNLLQDLQRDLGLALLFISHDLAVVEHMTHRVAVMYLGQIVEKAPRRGLFAQPRHPYTLALLSAAPVPDPDAKRQRIVLQGDVPSPVNPPKGCRFHTRCPFVHDRCRTEQPKLRFVTQDQSAGGHVAACHLNDLPDAENPLIAAAPVAV